MTKRLTLLSAVLLLSVVAFSQTQQGYVLLILSERRAIFTEELKSIIFLPRPKLYFRH